MFDEFGNPAERAVGGDAHADERGDAAGHGAGFGFGFVEDGDDVFGGAFQAHAGGAESEFAAGAFCEVDAESALGFADAVADGGGGQP